MLVKFTEESENEKQTKVELSEEEVIELSKKIGKEEYEKLKDEKYTPTEEEIEKIENALKNYNGPTEVINNSQPIQPTEEDLEKIEKVLEMMKPLEVKVEDVSEDENSESDTESQIKRLRYTKQNNV